MDPKYYVTLIKQLGFPPRISNCLKRMEIDLLFDLLITDPEDLPRLEDFEDRYLEEIYRKIGVFSCKSFHENKKDGNIMWLLFRNSENWLRESIICFRRSNRKILFALLTTPENLLKIEGFQKEYIEYKNIEYKNIYIYIEYIREIYLHIDCAYLHQREC